MTGTEQNSAHTYTRSSLVLLGGALQARTGMPAQPSWCKSLETTEARETKRTSGINSRRYFFATLEVQPGYLAGLNNVPQQSKSQPSRPNHHMIGFFDDISIDPAFAGSICVLNNYQFKNPAQGRVFHCTKENLSGEHHA